MADAMNRSERSRPPAAITNTLRVVPAGDLRQLKRLLLLVAAMQVVDLLMELWGFLK